jgi:hypothetical protein
VAREVHFFALLHLLRLNTDRDAFLDRVPELLERIEPLVTSTYRRVWVNLRRARWIAALGAYREAATLLEDAARGFTALAQSGNAGIALLHQADALIRLGPDAFDEADATLLEVQGIAREIGGSGAFQFELQPLTAVRGYLARGHGFLGAAALLEAGPAVRRVRFDADRVEINGVPAPLSARAARLMGYLATHPSSAWVHLRSAVFADLESGNALQLFAACREEINALEGFDLEYRANLHTYSLVWRGVTLEVTRG